MQSNTDQMVKFVEDEFVAEGGCGDGQGSVGIHEGDAVEVVILRPNRYKNNNKQAGKIAEINQKIMPILLSVMNSTNENHKRYDD